MGTLVGLRYNLGSKCTGSLGELNNCGYSSNTSEDYIQQSWDTELNNLSFPSWMSKSNQTMGLDERSLKTSFMSSLILDMQDFSKTDIFTETSNSHNSANLLSLTQLLGLSCLMNFIMCKSRQTNTNAELVGNVHSFTDYIFAQSQLERKARRRSHYPILKTFSYSNSLNASLTSLVEADHVHSKWDKLGTYFTKRRRRRHYNSESGLSSPEDNLSSLLLQDVENTENKNDDEEDKQSLSTNITTSIHLEEAQNISSTSLDMKTNNFGGTETSDEMACSRCQSEDNCLSLINRQNELLTVNTNENDAQFSLSAEYQNPTCINKLEIEIPLENITNSTESDDGHSLLHVDSFKPVNNIVNKPITRSLTSKSNIKINKSVSFADEVGKSLTEIFTLCDDNELYNGFSASRYYEFRQKLEKDYISLENISIIQSTNHPYTSSIKLKGTIKIKNICYEKLVFLRLTKNNWKTFNDYQAVYNSQLSLYNTWSNIKRYDTFIFNIHIESDQKYFDPNDKIEFAICFTALNHDHNHNNKIEYWDNNNHENYIIEQRKLRPIFMNMINIEQSQSSDDILLLSLYNYDNHHLLINEDSN
ncbi:protein phosphatase 1 binding protein, putative [Schistosoma mansoni]|uniref:protein phosphatase 1 binding protein, putative n=1 Tax=Schistosoma mansoni TaxID=6183 RepID=UPI0001A62AF1|nr:protein phosphatase 1 binding protein, putative [Schistosoma mansoni]|eukprot:XP_018645403.1 protein phosphatase 1 binding protein, putative [Schistosoma mansoni]